MTTATRELEAAPNPPASYTPRPMTQLGNAERFVDRYGKDVLYCPKTNEWFVWNGSLWVEDATKIVSQYMATVVRGIAGEAVSIEDHNVRMALLKWARQSEARVNFSGALEHVKHMVPILPDVFNQNPWVLNCTNGTLNLKTDVCNPHERTDYLTKQVEYDFDDFMFKDCPRWKQFLQEIFPKPYDEIIPFLQRAIGYSLTGSTKEHCLFLLHGAGANGKSVFIRVLQHVLGDYAMQADWQSFSMRKHSGMEIREDIARLAGSRFVAAIESAENVRLAENLVKAVTGGDKITARHLYKGSFEFVPQFKLWLATNHLPKIVGQDYGMWRRIRLVPFTVTFSEEERDTELAEKLMEEAPGILNWAREGLRDYQERGGLDAPDAVLQATAEYQNSSDQISNFLKSCTVTGSGTILFSDLYDRYKLWTDEAGESYKMSERDFNAVLKGRNLKNRHSMHGMVWDGLRLAGQPETLELSI